MPPATLTVEIAIPLATVAAHRDPDMHARHIVLAALDDVRRAILDPRQSAGEMRHSPKFNQSEKIGTWTFTPPAD